MNSARKETVVWTRDSGVSECGVRFAGSSDPPGTTLTVSPGARVEFSFRLRNANAILLRRIAGGIEEDVQVLYTTQSGEKLPPSIEIAVQSAGTYRLHSGLVWTAENWCVAELAKEVTLAVASQQAPTLGTDDPQPWIADRNYRLKWSIPGFVAASQVVLQVDKDIDGNGTSRDVGTSTAADGSGTLQISPGNLGNFNFTLVVTPPTGETVSSDTLAVIVNAPAGPEVTLFTGRPDPDDGLAHPLDSLQVEIGTNVLLSWEVEGADKIEITPDVGVLDASPPQTTVTPSGATDYLLVARSGSAVSDSRRVHVATHQPGDRYSPHVYVSAGEPKIEWFSVGPCDGNVPPQGQDLWSVPKGNKVTLAWSVDGDCDALEIDPGSINAEDSTSDAEGAGSVDVDPAPYADASGNVEFKLVMSAEEAGSGGKLVVVDSKTVRATIQSQLQKPRWRPSTEPLPMRLRLLAPTGPCAQTAFVLESDGETAQSTTDADGWATLQLEQVPGVCRVRFQHPLWGEISRKLAWQLPPIDQEAGVLARLSQLGYPAQSGRADYAVYAFQRDQRLDTTVAFDDPTRARLAALFGGDDAAATALGVRARGGSATFAVATSEHLFDGDIGLLAEWARQLCAATGALLHELLPDDRVVDVVSRPVRPLPSWVLDGVFAGLRGHMLVIAYRETERLELEDLADALAISPYEHVYLLSVGTDDAAQAAQDLQKASGLTVFTNKSPPQGLVIDPDSEDDDQERLQLRFLDPGRTFWAPSGAAADEELFATPEQFFTGAGVRFP